MTFPQSALTKTQCITVIKVIFSEQYPRLMEYLYAELTFSPLHFGHEINVFFY